MASSAWLLVAVIPACLVVRVASVRVGAATVRHCGASECGNDGREDHPLHALSLLCRTPPRLGVLLALAPLAGGRGPNDGDD